MHLEFCCSFPLDASTQVTKSDPHFSGSPGSGSPDSRSTTEKSRSTSLRVESAEANTDAACKDFVVRIGEGAFFMDKFARFWGGGNLWRMRGSGRVDHDRGGTSAVHKTGAGI
jgi:hypothetical protein